MPELPWRIGGVETPPFRRPDRSTELQNEACSEKGLMSGGAKHLFFIENKQKQILRFAQDHIIGGFSAALPKVGASLKDGKQRGSTSWDF